MSYVADHLDSDERVVHQARIHWIVYLGPVIMIGAGLVLSIPGTPGISPWGGLAVLGVGLLSLLIAWVRQISSEFAVTAVISTLQRRPAPSDKTTRSPTVSRFTVAACRPSAPSRTTCAPAVAKRSFSASAKKSGAVMRVSDR